MLPTATLLVHVFLGTATGALITKSYTTPLLLLFAYWTLGFLSRGIDTSPTSLLLYWTTGPTIGILGVICGTLTSNLFRVPRLLEALLLPNDDNKLGRTALRRLAWEVAVLHLAIFATFLGVKMLSGEFSDDSTSVLGASAGLGLGITIAVVALLVVVAVFVIACLGQTHRFQKRQNLKYFVMFFLMVGLLPLLAITALPAPASTWWVHPVYIAITLGIFLIAAIHTAKFTFFSGGYATVPDSTIDSKFTRKPFFDGIATFRDANSEERAGLLDFDAAEDRESRIPDVIYDHMIGSGQMVRFFIPLLVLQLVALFIDWVVIYWLQVTNATTHAIVLGVLAVLYSIGIIVAYFLLARRADDAGGRAAYPALAVGASATAAMRTGGNTNLTRSTIHHPHSADTRRIIARRAVV